jgi:hypothetical protein
MIPTAVTSCVTLVASLCLATQAYGQFTKAPSGQPPTTQLPNAPNGGVGNGGFGVPTVGGTPIPIPQNGGAGVPQNQLTPEQMQGVMMLRGLQNRGGRGQVRTGVPQDIGLGPQQGMMPFDGGFYDQPDASSRKSSSQRRAEARAAREEQKRAGGANPKDKKALAEKAKADKKALAEKRAKEAAEKKAKAAGKKPAAKKPLAKK